MRTHLEVEQREDIRRDLAERMKLVPPDLRPGEDVFHWQEHPGGNHCCQGPYGCHQYWHDNFQGLLVATPEDLRTKKAESFSPEKES